MREKPLVDEPRWHAALAVLVAVGLYLTLPNRIIVGPLWLMPLLILGILIPLMVVAPGRHMEVAWQRWLSIANIVTLNAFNIATLVQLFIWLLSIQHRRSLSGEQLLVGAVQIWLTNVIVYALWYWEIDGRGPAVRCRVPTQREQQLSDFLFVQMTLDRDVRERLNWKPRFLDYLFVSFTNATAFSPADTYPLTRLAKSLMMAEAMTSLVTLSIIAGRAINILGNQ
jgi:hypothetical protein